MRCWFAIHEPNFAFYNTSWWCWEFLEASFTHVGGAWYLFLVVLNRRKKGELAKMCSKVPSGIAWVKLVDHQQPYNFNLSSSAHSCWYWALLTDDILIIFTTLNRWCDVWYLNSNILFLLEIVQILLSITSGTLFKLNFTTLIHQMQG